MVRLPLKFGSGTKWTLPATMVAGPLTIRVSTSVCPVSPVLSLASTSKSAGVSSGVDWSSSTALGALFAGGGVGVGVDVGSGVGVGVDVGSGSTRSTTSCGLLDPASREAILIGDLLEEVSAKATVLPAATASV